MRLAQALPLISGALATAMFAAVAAWQTAPDLAARLERQANAAIATTGAPRVRADFSTRYGFATRHPILRHGTGYRETDRLRAARTVAAVPGVGGVQWEDGSAFARNLAAPPKPLHCQEDVEALLRARTIRFEESSRTIETASLGLIDEVVAALRPCRGSIIAIHGHTDSSGDEARNVTLSRERANAVRRALVRRGIPADALRAIGSGSREPIAGLDPADPANRRIEFSVISTARIPPTPVDLPAAR